MSDILTPSNIMFVLGILGFIFSVFFYFKNPQVESDKKDAVLAEQLKSRSEDYDRRFKEIQGSIKDAFALAQNHIHTTDTKVDALNTTVGSLAIELTKLATIIDERIPKK